MLVLALRSTVPPAAATSLALNLAETLVLLLGPCAEWGLLARGNGAPGRSGESGPREETRAILDRIFEGVLSQVDSPSWGPRMAPWSSFESSCLYLALPTPMHIRLAGLLADHGAQRSRAPFSFFRKHSCLMYRGLTLASDLHPPHAKQLWQLLWTLGLHQHSGGLPCQVLTRTVHLPQQQLQPAAGAAGGRSGGGGAGATAAAASSTAAAAAAAAAVALQVESGSMVSEQQMGRSLLVVAAALRLVLVVVLTAYDEEIEEELAGRLEGHSAAELLQRVHTGLGADLERLVEGSAIYSAAARALESPPPPTLPSPLPHPHPHPRADAGVVGVKPQGGGGLTSGGSLLFRVITRNRSSPQQRAAIAGGGGGSGGGGPDGNGVAGGSTGVEAPPPSSLAPGGPPASSPPRARNTLAASLPPGQPITPSPSLGPSSRLPTPPAAGASAEGSLAPAGQSHDRPSTVTFAAAAGGAGLTRGSPGPGGSVAAGFQPVPSPFEGVLLVIAHDAPHGCVRFLGDVPGAGAGQVAGAGAGAPVAGPGAGLGEAMLAAVWRAVAACRARFGLHNVAVAAPPKHARLTMTPDQILQLSAARSNKLGGQRLGAADSSPWQYHPELASLAAVNTVTLRLPISMPPPPPLPVAPPRAPASGGGSSVERKRGAGSGGGAVVGSSGSPPQRQQQPGSATAASAGMTTPPSKTWLSHLSGSRRGSPNPSVTSLSPDAALSPGPGPFTTAAAVAATASSPDPSTPQSGLVPALSAMDTLSLSTGGTPPGAGGSFGGYGGGGAANYTACGGAASVSGHSGFGPSASAASSSSALYLTGLLFPDMREVYLCHTAEVDEGRLAESIWEAASGLGGPGAAFGSLGGAGPWPAGELWSQED